LKQDLGLDILGDT